MSEMRRLEEDNELLREILAIAEDTSYAAEDRIEMIRAASEGATDHDDAPELIAEDLERKDSVWRIGGKVVSAEEGLRAFRAALEPSTELDSLIDAYEHACRRDASAGDKYTMQEVRDARRELVDALRTAPPPGAWQQGGPPWRFNRYVHGRLKAEEIVIRKAHTLEAACVTATQLAKPGDVLVLDVRPHGCAIGDHIWVGTGDNRVVCDDCRIERDSSAPTKEVSP